MIFVKALNAIYGITKAEILFYSKFVGDITPIGFKLNPYDPCVENTLINGNKMTVAWHVDYLKVSQKSKNIFNRMEKWPKKNYERLFEYGSENMKISRGNIHEYLGTILNFSEPGEVNITMIPYIEDMAK